ncbi:hypothetical protein CB473P2_00122 [Enterocloster phage CB473P2]|nr:hypothetical protein CB457P2_00121 [Enterocloster phage CB457P2]WAX11542.1 hypothetical protein CB473P2_00122 [Enterocloster phage CB473P2]
MTKNDLKTGMFIKITDGRIYFVLRDTGMNETNTTAKDILINFTNIKYNDLSRIHGWLSLDNYNEDLTFHTQDSFEDIFNIEEVYRAVSVVEIGDIDAYVKIWDRDKTKNEIVKKQLLEKHIIDEHGNFRDYSISRRRL